MPLSHNVNVKVSFEKKGSKALPQTCGGLEADSVSERIRKLLEQHSRAAKWIDPPKERTWRFSRLPSACTTKSECVEADENDFDTIDKKSLADYLSAASSEVRICCDCDAEFGVSPCVLEECPFIETESSCFSSRLPPLVFDPFTQCGKCGKRFFDSEIEEHIPICSRQYTFFDSPIRLPQEHRPELRIRELREITPPFILKKMCILEDDADSNVCESICGSKCSD